jgi:protein TonB
MIVGLGTWSAARALPLQTAVGSVIQAQPGPVEQRAAKVANSASLPSRAFSESPVFPPDAQAAAVSATITLRTAVDEAGNVSELRLAGFRLQLGAFRATMSAGPDSIKSFEEFLEKASVQVGSPGPTASELRPMLESLIESAALAAQRTRYAPPAAGRAVVFDTVVEFNRNASPVSRDVPIGDQVRSNGDALRVGGNVQSPRKMRDLKPVYPQEARDAQVQGIVTIEMRVEPDGRVGSARVLRSIPLLDQAALDAVQQWEFEPTLLNGAPVAVIMTVTVQFTLQ